MRALPIVLALAAASAARADPTPRCTDDKELDGPNSKPRPGGPSPKEYVGKTAAQLVATHGEPDCRDPARWRYDVPRGCAYERWVVTLRFAHGKVARATVVHVWTGEECETIE
jgi:hypothetical protein